MSLKEKYIDPYLDREQLKQTGRQLYERLRDFVILLNQPPPELIADKDALTEKAEEYLNVEAPRASNRVFVLISVFFTIFILWAAWQS